MCPSLLTIALFAQTVTEDLEAVAPLVVALANRYREYENSGSTVWDRTIDVRTRPEWLRAAATITDTVPEPALYTNDRAEEELDEFKVDVACSLPIACDPTIWEVCPSQCEQTGVDATLFCRAQGAQPAGSAAQLSNKHDSQWQQLEHARRGIERDDAEPVNVDFEGPRRQPVGSFYGHVASSAAGEWLHTFE